MSNVVKPEFIPLFFYVNTTLKVFQISVTHNSTTNIQPILVPVYDDFIVETFVNAEGTEHIFRDEQWAPLERIEDDTSGGK